MGFGIREGGLRVANLHVAHEGMKSTACAIES